MEKSKALIPDLNWFHCNHCAAYDESAKPYFLTNCGHIFCSTCVVSEQIKNMCANCHARNVKCLEIGPAIMSNPEVSLYFKPKLKLLKDCVKNQEFQMSQACLLINRLTKENAKLQEELDRKKEERKRWEEKLVLEREWLKADEARQIQELKTPKKPRRHPAGITAGRLSLPHRHSDSDSSMRSGHTNTVSPHQSNVRSKESLGRASNRSSHLEDVEYTRSKFHVKTPAAIKNLMINNYNQDIDKNH